MQIDRIKKIRDKLETEFWEFMDELDEFIDNPTQSRRNEVTRYSKSVSSLKNSMMAIVRDMWLKGEKWKRK